MIVGRVVSHLFATQKNDKLSGAKLLLVQPLELDDSPKGEAILAIDAVDAGISDRVIVVLEGWAANHALGTVEGPVDAAVVGVVDYIDVV
jgi:ethanolamine utilization protein EutN